MTLIEDFIPSLVGNQINETDFNIIEKPTRLAGLGIREPVGSSKHCYERSKKATKLLPKAITQNSSIDIDEYEKSSCAFHHF